MGIGISAYGEICAFGPSPATPAGGWESATVKIEPSGMVTVMTGISPHGQGEETTFAQIAADELGVDLGELSLVLPDFRYTARMASGVTENEVCPVFTATLDGDPQPDPAEVDSFAWVPWSGLAAAVDDPERYSPWMRLQLPLLADKRGG